MTAIEWDTSLLPRDRRARAHRLARASGYHDGEEQ